MSLTIIVLLVLALYVVQLFLQEISRYGVDLAGMVGNRDKAPDLSPVAARLERAKDNMREALPLFLGVSMLVFIATGDPNTASPGAALFLAARVLYVPAYVSGVPMLRSTLWLIGMGGILMMALRVIPA